MIARSDLLAGFVLKRLAPQLRMRQGYHVIISATGLFVVRISRLREIVRRGLLAFRTALFQKPPSKAHLLWSPNDNRPNQTHSVKVTTATDRGRQSVAVLFHLAFLFRREMRVRLKARQERAKRQNW